MKFNRLALSCMSCLSFLAIGTSLSHSVSAQNVQTDNSIQYTINGSRKAPQRSNDVEFRSQGACTGNASITTTVQGSIGGTGSVEQGRRTLHQMKCKSRNETGIDSPTIQIQTDVQADPYNPADNFNY